jgi:hypothetical protein
MHKSEFDQPLTLEQAYELILHNHTQGYTWYPVKTTCGNIIELGGTDKELKAYIIQLDSNNNIITHHNNDFAKSLFSISLDNTDYCRIDLPHITAESTKFNSKKQLLKWLNTEPNINFKSPKIKPIYTTTLSHYQLLLP